MSKTVRIKTSEDGVPKRPIAKRDENASTYTVSPSIIYKCLYYSKGFGHSLFTGVHLRGSNFAMTIGCLPAFLPLIIMIFFSVFTMFTDDDNDGETLNDDSSSGPLQRQMSFQNGEDYESDEFDWIVIIIMILFVCLPFLLAKFRRRN